MASPTTPLYPLTPTSLLTSHFIGKKLSTLPTPAIVLDRALIRRNCAAMLGICSALGVEFRAHVKSHKTIELSRMQILYGVPVAQSSIPRLISLATELAPGSIHVLIDNLDAFTKLCERLRSAPEAVQLGIFIKIDTGYERAGIKTSSPAFPGLVQSIVAKTQEPGSKCFLKVGLEAAVKAVPEEFTGKLVLSVGATPTATAAQNMLASSSPRVHDFQQVLTRLQKSHAVELHAGVYPLLDCQQVATHARPATISGEATSAFQPLSKSNISVRMLVEVTSVYSERGKPEALVSAGSLAMGREPCKSYPGWGIVTGDLSNSSAKHIYDEREGKTGWIVGRISQEHGILTWEG
ncbi:hypothetical protein PtrARCrB10_07348 [Pyrenophora tritici-repentis]|nr:hypothetical protein PtrARCrB10_07348 [Pyrenophora tritici-repentis]